MLRDILEKNSKIWFVGINPGLTSDRLSHYYAHPNNKFWQLLSDSNFTPVQLSPEQDQNLLNYGIGLTDVVRRASRNSSEAKKHLNNDNLLALNDKIYKLFPKIICFNGKTAYMLFFGRNVKRLGLQSVTIKGAKIFVVPSSSGSNTEFTYPQKLRYYRELKKLSEEM